MDTHPEILRQPKKNVLFASNKGSAHLKQLSMHDFVACGSLQAVDTESLSLYEKGLLEAFASQAIEELNLLSYLDNVVNLSDYILSDAKKSVLINGLKFCPTPGEPHMGETRRDLGRFHRPLRLECHFGKDQRETSIGPFNNTRDLKLKSNSNWNPLTGPSNIETVINIKELGLLDKKITAPKQKNISLEEKEALRTLAGNGNIIIKPADKGGASVRIETTA